MVSQTVDHQGDLKAIEGTQVTLHARGQPADQVGRDRFRLQRQRRPADDVRRSPGHGHGDARAEGRSPDARARQLSVAFYQHRRQRESAADSPPDRSHARRGAGDPISGSQAGRNRSAAESRAWSAKFRPTIPISRSPAWHSSASRRPDNRSSDRCSTRPRTPASPGKVSSAKNWCWSRNKLGLKVGDVLEYWAWAEDNKTPVANRTETIHRRVQIVAASESEVSPDALARNDQPSDDQPSHEPSADDKQPGNKPDSPDDQAASDDQAEATQAGLGPRHSRRIPAKTMTGSPGPTPRPTRRKTRPTRCKIRRRAIKNGIRLDTADRRPRASRRQARKRNNREKANPEKGSRATSPVGTKGIGEQGQAGTR